MKAKEAIEQHKEVLEHLSIEDCEAAIVHLEKGFLWSATDEGNEYWFEVVLKLRDLIKFAKEAEFLASSRNV